METLEAEPGSPACSTPRCFASPKPHELLDPVRKELNRYGLTKELGDDSYFPTVPEVVAAFVKRGS